MVRKRKSEIMAGVKDEVIASRFVAGNTVEYITSDKTRVVRYHETDIIRQSADSLVLDSGGWKTYTTKARLNDHQSMVAVIQKKGIWYACTPPGAAYNHRAEGRVETPFYDGITYQRGDDGLWSPIPA